MKNKNILLTKKEIYLTLGYKRMETVYKKILVEETIKELGFESMEEFKRTKIFNLKQTRIIRVFLNRLVRESFVE